MDLEGNNKEVVLDSYVSDLFVWDEDMYFLNYEGLLCVLDHKTGFRVVLPDEWVTVFTVNKEGIYYFSGGKISFVNHNGENMKVIYDNYISNAFFGQKFIYVCHEYKQPDDSSVNKERRMKIIRVNYDSTEEKVISEDLGLVQGSSGIECGDTFYFKLYHPNYEEVKQTFSLRHGVLTGPLNESSINPPDSFKKKEQ